MLTEEILKELDILFPDARCELNHKNNYEMLFHTAIYLPSFHNP